MAPVQALGVSCGGGCRNQWVSGAPKPERLVVVAGSGRGGGGRRVKNHARQKNPVRGLSVGCASNQPGGFGSGSALLQPLLCVVLLQAGLAPLGWGGLG